MSLHIKLTFHFMKIDREKYHPPIAEVLLIVPEGNMATSGVSASRQNYGDPEEEDWS